MTIRISRRHFFWIIPAAVLAFGGTGLAVRMMQPPPADLDLSLSKPTAAGRYVATLAAGESPVPVGKLHSWIIKLATPGGAPAEGVSIAIDGGMPQHGHGLPTRPEVTRDLGGGQHLIEGMKFSMPGWWTLTVHVDGPRGADEATFNLVL